MIICSGFSIQRAKSWLDRKHNGSQPAAPSPPEATARTQPSDPPIALLEQYALYARSFPNLSADEAIFLHGLLVSRQRCLSDGTERGDPSASISAEPIRESSTGV